MPPGKDRSLFFKIQPQLDSQGPKIAISCGPAPVKSRQLGEKLCNSLEIKEIWAAEI